MKIPCPAFAVTPYGDVDAAALENAQQSFDTAGLFEIVEQLESIAKRLRCEGGVRDDILRLHRMAHTVINGAAVSEPATEDIWELARELVDEFHDIADQCSEIATRLQPLAQLKPSHRD